MKSLKDTMLSYFGTGKLAKEEVIKHYGTPRHSGRYPWGSGGDPYQRNPDFLSRVETLKKSGWKETPANIKKEFRFNNF